MSEDSLRDRIRGLSSRGDLKRIFQSIENMDPEERDKIVYDFLINTPDNKDTQCSSPLCQPNVQGKKYKCSKCDKCYHRKCCFLRRCKGFTPSEDQAWQCYTCRTCAKCKSPKDFFNEQDFVHCTACDSVFHMRCQDIDKKTTTGSRDKKLYSFKCQGCRSPQPSRKKPRTNFQTSPSSPSSSSSSLLPSSSSPSSRQTSKLTSSSASSASIPLRQQQQQQQNPLEQDFNDQQLDALSIVSSVIKNGLDVEFAFDDGRKLHGCLQTMQSQRSSKRFVRSLMRQVLPSSQGIRAVAMSSICKGHPITYDTMHDVLLFLHTGRLYLNSRQRARELNKAAHLFGIEGLGLAIAEWL